MGGQIACLAFQSAALGFKLVNRLQVALVGVADGSRGLRLKRRDGGRRLLLKLLQLNRLAEVRLMLEPPGGE